MTKSPTTPTPDRDTVEPLPSTPSERSHTFLVWIYRLLLLGVGGTIAALIGIAVAHFYPAPSANLPLLEKLFQSSQSLLAEAQRLPQIWNNDSQMNLPPTVSSPSASPSTVAAPTSTAVPPLSAAEREKLTAELTQLQTEWQQLNDRTATLEHRLGEPTRQAALEQRLQAIQQQLNPNAQTTAPVSPDASASDASRPLVAPATSTIGQDDRLLVTLPADALFEANQTTLKPGTEAILDSIVGDLQQYAGATIRVTAHTDTQATVAADRARSFAQAKAVEQYLGGKLKEGYHWLVEGYGHSRPLVANDTPNNRQRNRRIEIIIEPQ